MLFNVPVDIPPPKKNTTNVSCPSEERSDRDESAKEPHV
jgi:hypothetical protein